jgi:hypothetical protein
MSTSNPTTWTAPSWHPDYGDAKLELDHLRAFALTLQVANGDLGTALEIPEPGYMYVRVSKGAQVLAEVYWREHATDYAVFVFGPRGEVEGYAPTEADAVAFVLSHVMDHAHAARGKRA